jgi:hypothetical protein
VKRRFVARRKSNVHIRHPFLPSFAGVLRGREVIFGGEAAGFAGEGGVGTLPLEALWWWWMWERGAGERGKEGDAGCRR